MKLTIRFAVAIILGVFSLSAATVAYASNWLPVLGTGSSGEGRAQAIPAAPTGLTATCATPASNRQVTVTWSTVSHATQYVVLQSHNSGSYTNAGTSTTGSWTSGTGLATGTYKFEIESQVGAQWVSTASTATSTRTISSSSPYCS